MTADDRTHDPVPGASPADHDTTQQYEIRVQGHLAVRWTAWFDGMSLSDEADGTTVIRGPVTDQSALHGVLHTLRDVGVPLISVTRISTDAPTVAPRADHDQRGT